MNQIIENLQEEHVNAGKREKTEMYEDIDIDDEDYVDHSFHFEDSKEFSSPR